MIADTNIREYLPGTSVNRVEKEPGLRYAANQEHGDHTTHRQRRAQRKLPSLLLYSLRCLEEGMFLEDH
jgi:hypothetical protein